jgi:hypothetical protein
MFDYVLYLKWRDAVWILEDLVTQSDKYALKQVILLIFKWLDWFLKIYNEQMTQAEALKFKTEKWVFDSKTIKIGTSWSYIPTLWFIANNLNTNLISQNDKR